MTFSARDVSNIRCDCHRPGCAYCDMDGSLTKHQDEFFTSLVLLNKNNTKKLLYKQNPKAAFQYIRKGYAHYSTTIQIETTNKLIRFEIPVSDMGDADFHNEMEAKHLIRWIANETENN